MATAVIMPALGMAQETSKVLKWLKAPGHAVRKGEPIVEIETDKVTVEIEAPASGVLRDVTAREGDVVPVGQAIALIVEEARAGAIPPGGTDAPSIARTSRAATTSLRDEPAAAPASAHGHAAASTAVKASP